jgi:hypothetical protein
MSRQTVGCLILVLVALCLAGGLLYQIPPVNDRLAWRVEALQARLRYALNPPEQAVFQPVGQPLPNLADQLPTATPTPAPSVTPTQPGPTATPEPTATQTLIPTPRPPQAMLSGITHMYQGWNNCGPANLAMALSFWGWQGDQYDTAAFLKPNKRDKNVMPYEMVDFVNEQTDLRALARVGGDLEILKTFVAAGFPVVVEKGFEGHTFDGWMGHYEVINGYDDAEGVFYVQDSYLGPNLKVTADKLVEQWRAFNNTYIAIYPPDREDEVVSILGAQADPNANYQAALEQATAETASLSGRDLYFAWFNRGANLTALHDYQNAAVAFDAAFANYPAIPKESRPWRMLWYQTAPYFAYYYTGRYQDVINLADDVLSITNEPVLEESYYWRGMARLALGDVKGAIADFRKSAKVHPGFIPAVDQLKAMGEEVK